jgi:hypothetical protein
MGERPGRITRRKLLAGTGKTAAAAAAASALGWIEIGNPAAAAEADRSGQVGTATGGRNAFEYVGQVDQDGDDLTSYGYLSAIAGLDVSQLFTSDVHDETTARFTYYGTATLFARVEFNGLFIIDAEGSVQYYFDPEGGASFSDPSSFKSGTLIAADTAKFHDVLSVTAPNTGMPYLTAALRRTKAARFVLAGLTYRFGHVGLLARSTATGLSTRLDPKPTSILTLGGDAVVVTGQP